MAKSLFYLQAEIHSGFLEIEQKQPEALPSVDDTFAKERENYLRIRQHKALMSQYEDTDSPDIKQLLAYQSKYLFDLKNQYKKLTRDLATLKANKRQFF